jgi:hypothetical protein
VFSSTYINYGTPPELYAIGPLPPPQLTATRAGNQIIINWPTNNANGLILKASATLGPGASWNAASPPAVHKGVSPEYLHELDNELEFCPVEAIAD